MMRPIMDLCEESEKQTGAWESKRWWYQEEINLDGVRFVAVMAGEMGEEDGAAG